MLDAARIVAVETGCCPHTAIREDITANLDAIEDLEEREGPLDLVLLESGGDNLTLTFSKGLIDVQLFVLDVAGGDKVPRKGGPGVTRSDLLVINKIDIAHLVNADLGVMERDAAMQRGELPTVFVSLTSPEGAAPVAAWIQAQMAQRGVTTVASGWTHTEASVRLRRGAGGTVRVDGTLCTAPLWIRWDGATLWLVGSGASPAGEDHIRVRVDVGADVTVSVRSVAATVVYAARGAGTRWQTELTAGEGACVDWRLEPVIITGRARHDAITTVHAAPAPLSPSTRCSYSAAPTRKQARCVPHSTCASKTCRPCSPPSTHRSPVGRVPPASTARRLLRTDSASAKTWPTVAHRSVDRAALLHPAPGVDSPSQRTLRRGRAAVDRNAS